jgi:hypothetical protein
MHRPVLDDSAKRKGQRLTVKEEALQAIYRDADKRICLPAQHVKAALRQAANEYKVPGRGRGTYRGHVMAGITVLPSEIPLHIPNNLDPEETWVLDVRPVRVQRARVLRGRPRFDKWELEFEIEVEDDLLDSEILKTLVEHAGRYEGIGDFRPEFGLFTCLKIEQCICEEGETKK